MSSKLPKSWPYHVKSGNSSVPVYRRDYSRQGREYVEFKVVFQAPDGRRRFESFADFSKAKARAQAVADAMHKGESRNLILSSEETLLYRRATSALEGLSVPLDAAAREFADAKRIVGPEVPLREAAAFFVQHRAQVVEKTVREVVDELVALRETRTRKKGLPASEKYLRELRYRLGTFAESFGVAIANVRPAQIEEFIVKRGITGRTRHNWLRIIRTLFKFAAERGYYPTGVDAFKGIETGFEDVGEIGIFTPAEMRRLLSAAWPEFVPFIAIGAFAGLRSAEIERLDWADIRPDFIEVTRGKAKTRQRRLVPIQPNLAAWLAIYRQEEGPVCAYANTSKQIAWLCEETAKDGGPSVVWKHNGLRHSFISYRMALTQNESATSAEAGNSPQMIHAHYRQLVTPEQAEEWFGIVPAGEAKNVVPMIGGAA